MIARITVLCATLILFLSRRWLDSFIPTSSAALLLYSMAGLLVVASLIQLTSLRLRSNEGRRGNPDPLLFLAFVFFALTLFIMSDSDVWLSAFLRLTILFFLVAVILTMGTMQERYGLKQSILASFGGLIILSFLTSQLGISSPVSGVFDHPNSAAMISAIVVAGARQIPGKVFRFATIVSAFLVGFYSGSSTWLVATSIIIPLQILASLPIEVTRRSASLAPVVALSLTFVPVMIAASPTFFAFVWQYAYEPSVFARLSVWKNSFDAFTTMPLMGAGSVEVFRNAIPAYGFEEQLLYSHNNWLTFLGVGGLFLTIPFTFLLARITLLLRGADISARLVICAVVVFSAMEYALQLDMISWIVALIFAARTPFPDPSVKSTSLESALLVGSDNSLQLANRTFKRGP